MNKKKGYFAVVFVPNDIEVKESGAAIVFNDKDGNEQTQQVVMFKVVGTNEDIIKKVSGSIEAILGLIDERLEKEKEPSLIVVP